MKRLILSLLSLPVVLLASPGTAHAVEAQAYCTVNSTYVSVAGHTVTTPSVTVPCP